MIDDVALLERSRLSVQIMEATALHDRFKALADETNDPLVVLEAHKWMDRMKQLIDESGDRLLRLQQLPTVSAPKQ